MSDPTALDRRLLERTQETFAGDIALIASEFLSGFQAVAQIDRPAVTTDRVTIAFEGNSSQSASGTESDLMACGSRSISRIWWPFSISSLAMDRPTLPAPAMATRMSQSSLGRAARMASTSASRSSATAA